MRWRFLLRSLPHRSGWTARVISKGSWPPIPSMRRRPALLTHPAPEHRPNCSPSTQLGAVTDRPMQQDSTARGSPAGMVQPPQPDDAERLRLRLIALSRWENEGGAGVGSLETEQVCAAPVDDPRSAAT